MKLNREPKTQKVVTLNLSEKKCDSYLTLGEVVIALEEAGRKDLVDEFVGKVKDLSANGKELGDFLELCSDYVNLKIV